MRQKTEIRNSTNTRSYGLGWNTDFYGASQSSIHIANFPVFLADDFFYDT